MVWYGEDFGKELGIQRSSNNWHNIQGINLDLLSFKETI